MGTDRSTIHPAWIVDVRSDIVVHSATPGGIVARGRHGKADRHQRVVDALYRVLERQDRASTSDVLAELGYDRRTYGYARQSVINELLSAVKIGTVNQVEWPPRTWGES